MHRTLKSLMLATDVGFIAYWLITACHLIPPSLLFRDYTSQVLVHWNWSFLPLDLLISATGITSLWLHRARSSYWSPVALVSLTLTSASGLAAISFWLFASDFSLVWWLPNLFLMMYPLVFIPQLVRQYGMRAGRQAQQATSVNTG
jgi:hypothetical protein